MHEFNITLNFFNGPCMFIKHSRTSAKETEIITIDTSNADITNAYAREKKKF